MDRTAQGANPNSQDEFDNPAICLAAEENHLQAVRVLLDAGAEPNTRDASGFPVIITAIENENLVMVKLLIDKGARIPEADTPLSNLTPGIKMLLDQARAAQEATKPAVPEL